MKVDVTRADRSIRTRDPADKMILTSLSVSK